jgi:NADH dehydrogenase [ubiquinone] 1 alpha subcomplex assembly factor 3
VLLIAGEAFGWKPWEAGGNEDTRGPESLRLVNDKGQFEVSDEAWGLLRLVWPKPGTCLYVFRLRPYLRAVELWL